MNNKRINQAYEALKNNVTIKMYDIDVELFDNDTIIIKKYNADNKINKMYVSYERENNKSFFNIGFFRESEFLIGCDIPNNLINLINFVISIY